MAVMYGKQLLLLFLLTKESNSYRTLKRCQKMYEKQNNG